MKIIHALNNFTYKSCYRLKAALTVSIVTSPPWPVGSFGFNLHNFSTAPGCKLHLPLMPERITVGNIYSKH